MTVPMQKPNTPGYCLRGIPVGERLYAGTSFCWAELYSFTLEQLAEVVRDAKLAMGGQPLDVSQYAWTIKAMSVSWFSWETAPGADALRANTLDEVYAALEAPLLGKDGQECHGFSEFDQWAREQWLANTMLRPVIGIQRADGLDLVDGLPCLAAAKHYGARDVYAIVGLPR